MSVSTSNTDIFLLEGFPAACTLVGTDLSIQVQCNNGSMSTSPVLRISELEYLAKERAADFKSEFVGGEVYAMSGGTMRHSRLAGKVFYQLESRLEGSTCLPFTSDLRIRTPKGNQFYPDVSVVCGSAETYAGNDVCTNPTLIVEVLSLSTSNYDRGLKFELYRQIPSLQEYLILHQDAVYAEHHSRQPDGSWLLREYRGEDAHIPLIALRCELPLGTIYSGVMELPG